MEIYTPNQGRLDLAQDTPIYPVTPPVLRDYQQRAHDEAEAAHAGDVQSVCVVAPTGAGKSVIGASYVRTSVDRNERVVWLAHREELLTQAAGHLRRNGVEDVAIVAPWAPRDDHARVLVASIDTLIARGSVPHADRVIWDECHHTAADTHSRVHDTYMDLGARITGLTATPQRADGRSLGNHYQRLVVAASYSELLAAGHLSQCKVFRPEKQVEDGLGNDPVRMWAKLAEGGATFAFCRSVADARKLAQRFRDELGVGAACIDGKMSSDDRARVMDGFRAGDIRILTNVYVLTEGVDVPDASVCLLARNVGHAGPYLQMVGRVLRVAEGKEHARLIDLTGCSHVHGLPTADREYALSGRAIKCKGEALKACPQCGYPAPAAWRECDEAEGGCGYKWPQPKRKSHRIYDLELREAVEAAIAAGGEASDVGDELKRKEMARLLAVAREKGFAASWAAKEYARQFGPRPPVQWMREFSTQEQRQGLMDSLRKQRHAMRYKPGWEHYRFKAVFGEGGV